MSKNKYINSCEVCGNTNIKEVLDLGNHPLCDDLIEIGSGRVNNSYPIKVGFCKKCLTAHQIHQVSKDDLFPSSYHYRARFTKDVLDGMKDLVNFIIEEKGSLKNKVVLDIGCNDGSLLDFFSREGAFTVGVEPTNASKDAEEKGHKIFNCFFDRITANSIKEEFPKIDFITFTNVFAHIDDLPELLHNLQYLLKENTSLIIENHYLGSILSKYQFDTFYHEHPRTYSLSSFMKIAYNLKMNITKFEFPKRYGGNIRVFIEKKKNLKQLENINSVLVQEKKFFDHFKEMEAFLDFWKKEKRTEILALVDKYGPIPAKAFPGRASILIKFLELNEQQISAVYERSGSKKINHYVPGTKIPILDEKVFFDKYISSKAILNLAWHICDEIKSYLKENGFSGQVINIIDTK